MTELLIYQRVTSKIGRNSYSMVTHQRKSLWLQGFGQIKYFLMEILIEKFQLARNLLLRARAHLRNQMVVNDHDHKRSLFNEILITSLNYILILIEYKKQNKNSVSTKCAESHTLSTLQP